MTARTLYFTGAECVELRSRTVPEPGAGEVRVRTQTSAVSAGTEGLIYRGEAPTDLPADDVLDALDEDLSYPLSYGYAAVGRVSAVGSDVDDSWLGRRVFAYNPHASHFLAEPETLVPIPDGISNRQATLFANAETAVTFLLDGQPAIGERVAVFGQGVVGLLTTALLAETPAETVVAVDRYDKRRSVAAAFGADETLEPNGDDLGRRFQTLVGDRADLTYELSGNPEALDDAVPVTGFDGRIIVGSWYGTKPVELDLGGRFHRDRIELSSSQVSTIAPRHEGRWSRERRRTVAWEWLDRLDLEALFTHEIPFERASDAYRLLEERPAEAIQVRFTYQ